MSRASSSKQKDLFTASEVAGFCQVDLKTIHNWADRGEIQHFRTPGRHLRFRRLDVLDFLRRYGYPVPMAFGIDRPKIVLADADARTQEQVRGALAARFDVFPVKDLLDGLLMSGVQKPDAVIVDAEVAGLHGCELVGRLKAEASTQHIRSVVYSSNPDLREDCLKRGASAFVVKPDLGTLEMTLARMLGVTN